MITFERLTIDTDFEVFDILHNGTKIGWLRKSDKYYMEVLYTPYTLRLNQRRFVMPVVRLLSGFKSVEVLNDVYVSTYNFKTLTEDVKERAGFTIKN